MAKYKNIEERQTEYGTVYRARITYKKKTYRATKDKYIKAVEVVKRIGVADGSIFAPYPFNLFLNSRNEKVWGTTLAGIHASRKEFCPHFHHPVAQTVQPNKT